MGLFDDEKEIFGLEVTERCKSIFLNMARWTKFLAITGFIVLGLMLLFYIFAIFKTSEVNSGYNSSLVPVFGTIGSFIFTLIMGGIYFYPTYMLYMYSVKVKRAMLTSDSEQFESALIALKNTFQYMAILVIIMIIMLGVSFAAAFMIFSKL